MEQLEFFTIPNPCKGICETNNKGFCMGCYRKREERQYWSQFTDTQKQKILRLCRQRKLREQRHLQEQNKTQPVLTDSALQQNNLPF